MESLIERVREAANAALIERRANQPPKIENGNLYAGSPMFFYCQSCGWLADVKPEEYLFTPRTLCSECAEMKERGWL